MEQQKEQLAACGMSASCKPLQSAKREFQFFCTCAEASSYNPFSPVRRAVPFFCTEKRNQKACQGGMRTIHLHASVRLPPWIPLHSTGLGAEEKPSRTGSHAHSTEHNSDVSAFRMEQPSPMPGKVPSAARRKRSETAAAEIPPSVNPDFPYALVPLA